MHAQTPEPVSPTLSWFWMFVLWGMMWILMGLGSLNLLILPVMAFLLVNVIRAKSWRPVTIMALSPMSVLFVAGVISWFGERPAYSTAGLPGADFFNLNREHRTYAITSGCLLDGGEFLRQAPFNLGMGLMCRTLGWPPKMYHGSYPTAEEAVNLTDSGTLVPLEEFREGKIKAAAVAADLGEYQTQCMMFESGAAMWEPGLGMQFRFVRLLQVMTACS